MLQGSKLYRLWKSSLEPRFHGKNDRLGTMQVGGPGPELGRIFLDISLRPTASAWFGLAFGQVSGDPGRNFSQTSDRAQGSRACRGHLTEEAGARLRKVPARIT